jgi:hypothetical protein
MYKVKTKVKAEGVSAEQALALSSGILILLFLIALI